MSIENEEVSSEEQGGTPTPEESAPQAESEGAEQQAAAPEKPKEEPQVPFHEHPRFKELIDERRSYKEQLDKTRGYVEAMQRELQAVRANQAPKAPNEPKYKPLIDQLRTLNPQFADFQEELISKLDTAREEAALAKKAIDRIDKYEQRDFQNSAETRLSSLMESNSVPKEFRKRYDREVKYLAYQEENQGRKLGIDDVDRIFKAVHEEYTPFIEGIRRDSLKGYVKEKVGDKTPTAATGGAAVVNGASKIKAGDDESVVKWMAKELRAAKKV